MPCDKPSTCDCICTLVTLDVTSVSPGADPIEVACDPSGIFEGCRCDLAGTADDLTTTVTAWAADSGVLYVEVYYNGEYYYGYATGVVCDGAAGEEGRFSAASVTCYSELEASSIIADIGGPCIDCNCADGCSGGDENYEVVASGFTGSLSWVNGTYSLTDPGFGPCYWSTVSPPPNVGLVEIYPDVGFHILQFYDPTLFQIVRYEGVWDPSCSGSTPCAEATTGYVYDPFAGPNPEAGTVTVTPI